MISGTWLATSGSMYFASVEGQLSLQNAFWGSILGLSSLVISLVVNAVVTGLIVFKILKVYRGVRPTIIENQTFGIARDAGAKLRSIMFIIIESGMAMFTIQLIRVVLFNLQIDAMYLTIGINQQLNVIIRSVTCIHLFFSLY